MEPLIFWFLVKIKNNFWSAYNAERTDGFRYYSYL